MTLTGGYAVLQLHPTRRCNLTCMHCYSRSGPSVDAALSIDTLRAVLYDAADLGYDVVGISGGEPLMYPPLRQLLQTAKSLGLRTTVTTNGTLLTDRRLAEIAGLVDVLAISLDGAAATHNRIRNSPRAFQALDARVPAVKQSGIPFGFITTLTMHNVDELAYVVGYAREHGASIVQIHPLESEGAACDNLPESIPDGQELAFAIIEGTRLSLLHDIPVQIDIAHLADLTAQPDRFLVSTPDTAEPLARWLSPLVVETDGTVVPLTYGFPHLYQLGNVHATSLKHMAQAWDPSGFLAVCQQTAERLIAANKPLFNWYEQVCAQAHPTNTFDATFR